MTIYRPNPLLMTVMGANPGPRRPRRPDDALDDAIGKAWHRLMSGVQVSVMDIPKIFRDIKLEISAGVPLEQAVLSVGSQYRVNRNPIGEAIVGGVAGALVNRAFQSNPGPAFIVIDAITGRVGYSKRAAGTGDAAIASCTSAAQRIADRVGRPQLIFLDIGSHVVGSQMSVAMVRVQGITDEIYPKKFGGFQPNPHLEDQPCASCGGSLAYQGTLGNREHYRCRNCGMDCSTEIHRTQRRRRFRKLCAHGRLTNRCPRCRGRKIPSHMKPCIHGFVGGRNCIQCMRHQRPGGPVRNNPAIRNAWNLLKTRPRLAVLEFAGIPEGDASFLCKRQWAALPDYVRVAVSKGWRDTTSDKGTTRIRRAQPVGNPRRGSGLRPKSAKTWCRMCGEWLREKGPYHVMKVGPQKGATLCDLCYRGIRSGRRMGEKWAQNPQQNPGPRGRRKLTLTIQKFAEWVKSKKDPAMWKAFLAKFRGYEKWTHGARARKVHLEWVDTPGVNGLWITYDGGKQPESTYIMPKGSPRKGAWKHPWDTMPDIKHDPEAKIVITKLRGQSKITDFYHK